MNLLDYIAHQERLDSKFKGKETIGERFERFHSENPHIFLLFVKYALEAKRRGYDKFGAKAIVERMRWHLNIETTGDYFLLNNDFTAHYSRKAMDEIEELKGFFHLREKRTQ